MKTLLAVSAAAAAILFAQPASAADFIKYRLLLIGSVGADLWNDPANSYRLSSWVEFNMPVSALNGTSYTYSVDYVPSASPRIRDEISVIGPRIYITSLFQETPGGPSRTANITLCGGYSGNLPAFIPGASPPCSNARIAQYPGDPVGTPTLQFAGSVLGASATLLDGAPSRFGLVGVPNLAVPEPGTWALMLVGFGMIGGAIRYRRGTRRIAFAR